MKTQRNNGWLLLLSILLPGLTTYLAFIVKIAPQIVYPICKIVLIGFPILWVKRQGFRGRDFAEQWGLRFSRKDLLWGLGTGIGIGAFIATLYFSFFNRHINSDGIVETLPDYVLNHYILAALVVSLWNSLLEEYYWRAFLMWEMEERWGWKKAVLLNGPLFGIHHIIILGAYFPWPQAILFTFGTVLGGWIWAWMRMKGLSSWSCYISHVIVDLTALAIGGMMLLGI